MWLGQVLRAGQAEATRQLRRRQPSRQLEQRQRVASRLGDDPVAHPRRSDRPHRRVEQRARRPPSRRPCTSSSGRGARAPSSGSRAANTIADRLGQQATGDEGERLRRGCRATARRRPHTAADAPRPPPRTGSTPPSRRGTDPGRRPRSARTRSRAPGAAVPGSVASRSSIGPHSWCRPANASSISDSTPAARTTVRSDADSIRYLSSAVLPIPASPRRTSDRLSPRRTSSINPSSAPHSSARPSRLMRGGGDAC